MKPASTSIARLCVTQLESQLKSQLRNRLEGQSEGESDAIEAKNLSLAGIFADSSISLPMRLEFARALRWRKSAAHMNTVMTQANALKIQIKCPAESRSKSNVKQAPALNNLYSEIRSEMMLLENQLVAILDIDSDDKILRWQRLYRCAHLALHVSREISNFLDDLTAVVQ